MIFLQFCCAASTRLRVSLRKQKRRNVTGNESKGVRESALRLDRSSDDRFTKRVLR